MLTPASTNDYTALMARRIRRILLVCNNYDSFALEEDGHIDVQIAQEYAELNLSNPPAIIRAETTGEALGRLNEGFDLIIIVSNGAHGVLDDAAKMKSIAPETPIVLLSAFSKVAFQQSTQLLSSGAAPEHGINFRPHLHEGVIHSELSAESTPLRVVCGDPAGETPASPVATLQGAAWRPHLHEGVVRSELSAESTPLLVACGDPAGETPASPVVAPIDYFFCWNNSADLIIAIIKLLEDKLNAEHDILTEGVRAIILVEDSVRYYSTYLPLLYKLVLQQNKIAIQDALNEKQQIVRKRARPKVLMATCLDEAMSLYNRYKHNIIGVISDIGFVRHKGDPADTEQLDAGMELCRLIRHDNPTMPFLLQSSQESMREMAEQMHVGFIVKKSKTLTQELSDYIGREFGFGDFVAIDPRTHAEIGRAHDLEAFEHLIARISPEAFRYLSDNNYLSKWLFARGLFAIGQQVSPLTIKDDSDIERVRNINVKTIHDYRINQAQGVVAKYHPESYNDTIWFARCGNGALGGKGRGLAFLNHILQKYDLYDQWEGVRILVPRTMVITTDYFDQFIHDNGLQYVINSEISDEEILSEFVASTLPRDLTEALRHFIRVSHRPIAVRSSSKLEDSYYQPFAGVYSTYMIPHTENEDQELRLLSKAIKSVYASVYYAASRGYITSTANVLSEEKMAIIVQEVCGEREGDYYFPVISGVARSINFYPVGYEKPEEGIVKVAYGLGKAVVDGDQVLRFSPAHPKHVMQTSTPDLTMRETQQYMYALSLQPERFKTSVDDAVNLERIPISQCEGLFPSLRLVASTFDMENMRMVDSCYPQGPRYITFAPQLKFNTFPLADIVKRLLEVAQAEIKCPVEIEFAVNLEHEPMVFHVLQIRPISADGLTAKVDWENVDCSHPVISSGSALGVGKVEGVRDIIYIRKEHFDILRTQEMAQTIRTWNKRCQADGTPYVLIGFGRWGSQIPTLGVPVQWSDISEAKALVECSLEDFRVDPSQGSHFFQNMTSFNVGYINVDPFARADDAYDFAQLDALPAVEETEFVRHVRVEEELEIYIDGYNSRAVVSAGGCPL